jgi:hypothetical protein
MFTIPLFRDPASRRRVVPMACTAAVAVAATGLLAACASSSSSSAAATATPGSQTQQAGTSSSPAPGSTQSTLPGTAGLVVCQSGTLKVSVDTNAAGGAMGSTYYPVNFTNTSATACGMYGYPGMSFVTAASGSGSQIGAPAQENPSFGRETIKVPAGGTAHAWLQVAQAGNYPASTCQPATAHGLRIYPPGDTVATYADVSFSACASTSTPLLTVMPVRSGQAVRGVTP